MTKDSCEPRGPDRYSTGRNSSALFPGSLNRTKKQGAAGITTAAPYIAGQWGRGDNRLSVRRLSPRSRSLRFRLFFPANFIFPHTVK
jgi:hypothetical protein